MVSTELGTDEQYLESWLQFNVAYRANVASACHSQSLTAEGADGPATALECFQQYLFSLEDLATWAAAIGSWEDGPLAASVETANAKWTVFEQLASASPATLVELFVLPPLEGWSEKEGSDYQEMLTRWSAIAREVGTFASRQAQNGGQLANRLQNKMKHGLHFAVGNDNGELRAHFYPHSLPEEGPAELPSLRLAPASAERWLRRTYDLARLMAALLRALFVHRFKRDPLNAWQPRNEPGADLSIDEIKANLADLKVPTIEWFNSNDAQPAS